MFRRTSDLDISFDDDLLVIEGAILEDVLAEVYRRFGRDAQIVVAERNIVGGLGGFFGSERFHVEARPAEGEDGDQTDPADLPPEPVDGPSFAAALAEALSGELGREAGIDADWMETEDYTSEVVRPRPAPSRTDAPVIRVARPAPSEQAASTDQEPEHDAASQWSAVPPAAVAWPPAPAPAAGPPSWSTVDLAPALPPMLPSLAATSGDAATPPPFPDSTESMPLAPLSLDAPPSATGLPLPPLPPRAVAALPLPLPRPNPVIAEHLAADTGDVASFSELSLAELLTRMDRLAPPVDVPAPAGVVAVVGDVEHAVTTARRLAERQGAPASAAGVLLAPDLRARDSSRVVITSLALVEEHRERWARREGTTFVAVALDPGDAGRAWAQEALHALSPAQIRYAAPAWRCADELQERISSLGSVDCVDLVDLDQATEPAEFLTLRRPVATIDGRPVTPELWAAHVVAARHTTTDDDTQLETIGGHA